MRTLLFKRTITFLGNAIHWIPKKLQFSILTGILIIFFSCTYISFNQLQGEDKNICQQTDELLTSSRKDQLPQLPSAEFYIQKLGANSPRRGDMFDPQINETELRATVKLLWKFLDLCEKHGLRAMLFSGSLFGSYRHHGFIPWDDDLDLLLDWADNEKLLKALNGNSDFRVNDVGLWKVSLNSACLHVDKNGCWPFIDIGFFEVQGNRIVQKFGSFSCPVRYTLPMHKRPFMGRWVDAPRDSAKFLSCSFMSLEACMTYGYSHKFEAPKCSRQSVVNCKKLAKTYPFVFRVPDTAPWCRGVLETLRLPDGELAYTVLVNEPVTAQNSLLTLFQ